MSKQDLNVDDTVNFAKTIYGENLTATNVLVYTHCISVARLAEKIAHKLFGDMRRTAIPQDVDDIVAAIVHSAILSETINTKRVTFEQIADVANVQIATMVATLSRDLRLVETKRDIEFRGRLSTSPLPTQIVATSNIICTAQEIVRLLNTDAAIGIQRSRKLLTQLDGDLLCVHAVDRYYTLRLYAHAARNLIIDANQIIKKLKLDARNARTAAKISAGIKSRQAAKTSLQPEDASNAKKRNRRAKG